MDVYMLTKRYSIHWTYIWQPPPVGGPHSTVTDTTYYHDEVVSATVPWVIDHSVIPEWTPLNTSNPGVGYSSYSLHDFCDHFILNFSPGHCLYHNSCWYIPNGCLGGGGYLRSYLEGFGQIRDEANNEATIYQNYYGYLKLGSCTMGTKIDVIKLGISEQQQENFEAALFPNPTDGPIKLDLFSRRAEAFEVRIINPMGMVVKSISLQAYAGKNQFEVNVQELASGIYSVIINGEGHRTVKRFSKL